MAHQGKQCDWLLALRIFLPLRFPDISPSEFCEAHEDSNRHSLFLLRYPPDLFDL